jgi:hypothetical protein
LRSAAAADAAAAALPCAAPTAAAAALWSSPHAVVSRISSWVCRPVARATMAASCGGGSAARRRQRRGGQGAAPRLRRRGRRLRDMEPRRRLWRGAAPARAQLRRQRLRWRCGARRPRAPPRPRGAVRRRGRRPPRRPTKHPYTAFRASWDRPARQRPSTNAVWGRGPTARRPRGPRRPTAAPHSSPHRGQRQRRAGQRVLLHRWQAARGVPPLEVQLACGRAYHRLRPAA